MVAGKSEYQRQYRRSTLRKNLPVYYENVTYRYHRRELECAHTPIGCEQWEYDTENISDNEENSTDECEDTDERSSIADKNIQTKIEDRKEEKEEENIKDIEEQIDKLQLEKNEKNVLTKSMQEKIKKYASEENKDTESPTKPYSEMKSTGRKGKSKKTKKLEKVSVKRARPRRPDRCDKIPKARPSSAPQWRESAHEKKPPFISYGWADAEEGLSVHRTHNIRSSTDIYPAALRAQRRRQFDIKRRQDAEKKTVLQDKRRKYILDQELNGDKYSPWETEYQRHFAFYDQSQYANNISPHAHKRTPVY